MDTRDLHRVCAQLSVATATSYVELKHLPISELVQLVDDVADFVEETKPKPKKIPKR